MNRAERRKNKVDKPERVYNVKVSDITRMEEEAAKRASRKVFLTTVLLPLLVLHDKFGFGEKRCERFFDAMEELLAAYGEGYLTTDDILKTLKEEIGLTFVGVEI